MVNDLNVSTDTDSQIIIPISLTSLTNTSPVNRKFTDKYIITEKLIGQGSKGNLFVAINKNTLKKCAVKLIPKKIYDNKELTEFKIMKDLNHINIIQLYDYYETNTKYFLFMELCD